MQEISKFTSFDTYRIFVQSVTRAQDLSTLSLLLSSSSSPSLISQFPSYDKYTLFESCIAVAANAGYSDTLDLLVEIMEREKVPKSFYTLSKLIHNAATRGQVEKVESLVQESNNSVVCSLFFLSSSLLPFLFYFSSFSTFNSLDVAFNHFY